MLANPSGWPGRLSQAVEELRLAAPEAGFLALLEPREPLERDDAVLAGFDDAFVKHARTYPVLARLAVEIAERLALGRAQQRVSRARADAELLLAALMAVCDAGVAVLAADGTITVANGQLCRMAGRQPADLLRSQVWTLLDGAGTAALRAALEGPSAGQANVRLALDLLTPNGPEPADGRLALRELGDRQRTGILCLRPAETAAAAPTAPVPAPREASLADLRTALRGRRAPAVVARIRPAEDARAGARSPALPPEAVGVVRAALRDVLADLAGENDLLFAVGEDTYLLMTGETSLAAMRRLGRLVYGAREALQRSPRLAHELLLLGGASLAERLDGVGEPQALAAAVDVGPEDLVHPDLPTLLATRLQAEEALLGGPTLRRLNELQARATCELAMVQDQDGAPSALCLPRPNEVAAAQIARLAEGTEDRPELALQLALLTLELTVEALAREVDRDSALAIIDLHLGVLGQRRLADRFLDRCRSLPPGIVRSLVVNLLGVPPGAYAPKLARVTVGLQDLFRLRAITIRDIRAELIDLDLARVGVVIVDYRDVEPFVAERQDVVQALARKVHKSQARLLVRRVARGAATDLRERLGVDLTSSA